MSLFIIGSVSRVTSNIIHHLAKHGTYKSVTIADLLPAYEYHSRFYRLQSDLDQFGAKLNLNLTRLTSLNDLKKSEQFDDVLYVTHDYYQNVVSKTRLMELTATANKGRKYLYFATPVQYDHFGYSNPEAKYLESEKKVLEINPNSTIIRSDIQDNTEVSVALKGSTSANFKPNTVRGSEYATIVCNTLTSRIQGKRILVRGSGLVQVQQGFTYKTAVDASEFKHAKENIGLLANKYGSYTFQGYENYSNQRSQQAGSN